MSDQPLTTGQGRPPTVETATEVRTHERSERDVITAAPPKRWREQMRLLPVYVFLVVMSIFALFPVYYVLQASFRANQTLYTTNLELIPTRPTFDNYVHVLTQLPFLNWVANSLYVCGMATLVGLFISTSAAYALARFRFKGRQMGLVLLIAIQTFPSILALTAYYLLLNTLGLLNRLEGLALVYAAQSIVFGVWNTKGYFDTIPIELEQSALVDGATPTRAFLRITLPLALPALVSSAMFMFLGGWNEFAVANILLNANATGSNLTFPVGLYGLQSDFRVPWGYFAAASTMIAVPVAAIWLWLQRYLISGLTIGSVKG